MVLPGLPSIPGLPDLSALAGLAGASSSFGSVRYDPEYPAGFFSGFTISVDAVSDPTLGGGWQSVSLGSMELNTNDVPAGGYSRTTFREVERITYGEVTMSRAWNPGTSAQITEWFSRAHRDGPCNVAVTIEVPGVGGDSLFGASGLAGLLGNLLSAVGSTPSPGKKYSIIFRNCLPRSWNAPSFRAGVVEMGQKVPPTSVESLTFSFSGYAIEAFSGSQPMVDSSITTEERVEPCKLVIIPNTGGTTRKMLAKMSSWTVGQSALGGLIGLNSLAATATAGIAAIAAQYDAIEFFLPPASIKVKKGASWELTDSASAEESGPLTWMGTQPMKLEFEFLMRSQSLNPRANSLGYGKAASVMPNLKKLMMLCENYTGGSFWSTGGVTPPLVMLFWGSFVSPLSIVTGLSAQLVKFDKNGDPIKAVGNLELTQFPTSNSLTNPTSGGMAPEMADTVLQGDTLAHLAYRTYQSPRHWRDIAAHNGIDDPMRVRAGRRVILPSPTELPMRNDGGTVVDERASDESWEIEE